VVSLHAVIADGRALHVYAAQTAVTGAYGFLRVALWRELRPEHDAVVFLAMGFVLIGVTVVARRRGGDTVADATRRFAAILPVLAAVVLPWVASNDAAIFALASSALYAALGWAERSRVLGTFGAVAANVALLVASLTQGLDGFDVYFVPLGLLLCVVVHIFADVMEPAVRVGLRFVGTALGFAPAALAIVLQIGNANTDGYPLGFAGACLVAVVAGMWFHVRAYLVLGTTFLLLDLGTLLVRASLRDQRLGFFVLSAAGLAILAAMAGYTMRKEQVRAALRRLRRALRGWD
jgi:hypothetical protein